MTTSFKTSYIRSSAVLVLLFCFQGFALAMSCPGDTIIVDGKPVIVERRVSYQSDSNSQEEEPRKKRILRTYIGSFGMAGGLNQSWQYGQNEFATVSEFVGRRLGRKPLFRAEALFGFETADTWLFEGGLSLSYLSVPERYFVGSALNDSLFNFAISPDRLLDQITRERVLTGAEFYRLPVELKDGSYTQLGVEVPLQVMYRLPFSTRDNIWYAGAGIRGRYVLNAVSDNWVLIQEGGAVDFVDQDAIKQQDVQADWSLLFGTRIDLNPKSYVTARAFISMPIIGPMSDASPFDIRWMQVGASVAINKIFRRDQTRGTTKSR